MGPENQGQFQIVTSGAGYNTARLTASLTSSHLLTDLSVKWREIEFDRRGRSSETTAWSPFAKAVQNAPFKYLSAVTLDDALAVRNDGRLEDLRAFLRRVWKQACDIGSYDSLNASLLAEELHGELRRADEEWKQIDRDLLKNAGAIASGLAAAGPLIGTGAGEFLAAASLIGGIPLLASSTWQRHGFPDKFPAAFFLQIERKPI